MNYIVFDLEWNQGSEQTTIAQMPFEIVEIGAVKLNEEFQQTGTFQVLIQPQVYHVLHTGIQRVVPIKMEELKKKGKPFEEAIAEFLAWCGDEYRFCTWGSMDLVELQRNMQYYHIPDTLERPLYYYDVQKCYGMQFLEGKKICALDEAVQNMNIEADDAFHRALADACYTAQILVQLDRHQVEEHFSVDYFRNPVRREEELFLRYPECRLHITREFDTKEEMLVDMRIRNVRCLECGKPARLRIRWFTNNAHSYLAYAQCPQHGGIVAKISIKKNDRNKVFGLKYLRPAEEGDEEKLRERRNELRQRRRDKKRRERLKR